MSDQANRVTRPSAPPPEHTGSNVLFFDMSGKRGLFEFSPTDNAPKLGTRFVMGYYRQHWLEWDEGRDASRAQDRIAPRWKLRVILDGAESEGERKTEVAWLTIGPKTAFFGAAHGLAQCSPEEFVAFRIVPGDDGFFVNVVRWDGAQWKDLYGPKNDGRDFADRYEDTVVRIRDHAGYKAYEKKAKDGDASAAPASGAASESPSVRQGEASRVAELAAQARGAAPAADEEAEVAAPSPLPAAFGLQATRWVRSYRRPAKEAQTAALAELGERKGLTDASLRNVAERVLLAYNEALPEDARMPPPVAGKPLSSGCVTLAYDWLENASKEQVDRAIAASLEEYDPFADE